MRAFPHGGLLLMLQKNSEHESVRDQQQRHHESRNKIGGSQLPRQQPIGIALIKSVEQIRRAPEIEYPYHDNTGPRRQCRQRKQREDHRNDVAIGRGMREGRRQIWRHDPRDQECQPEKAKTVQNEQRPQRFGPLPVTEYRPDVSGGDGPPRDQTERDAREKTELWRHDLVSSVACSTLVRYSTRFGTCRYRVMVRFGTNQYRC